MAWYLVKQGCVYIFTFMNVARMRETRSCKKFWWGSFLGNIHLNGTEGDGRITLG
jgi:hypothetical protein